MLKFVTLHFSEPLCACDTLSWSWGFKQTSLGTACWVACKICGVEIVLPVTSLSAMLESDKPYPNKAKHSAPVIKLRAVPNEKDNT